MQTEHDFLVNGGVLEKYVGPGGTVTVPEGVTEISKDAFIGYEDRVDELYLPKQLNT